MVAQYSGQNSTESSVNQVTSEDEIKTNVIISGITKENGQTQYYISGIQKDKIHVPRIPELSVPQSIKNVPPCSCPIQQMADKDINSSASKEDIPWTKEEGLCPGKKYRPNELGAYSCKTYPADQFCRYNPFMKELMKMERRKIEKRKEEEEMKEKTESIEAVKKETQISAKKDKFIPDPDYPAYDDPWNILRTAPSAEITGTDYEATLKLTPPAWPTTSSPLKMQSDISSSKELKKIETLNEKNDKKILGIKNSSIKKKIQVSGNKITINKKGTKLSNTISRSKAISKMQKKQQSKSSLPNKRTSAKRNRIDEIAEIENRKREMTRLKNMFKSFGGILSDIQPAVLPEELLGISQRNLEQKTEEIVDFADDDSEEKHKTKKEPCGWRTKSEQELPAKKTLAYLCEPDYPLETVAVSPGGRPCRCRENRNKKKIRMYNVSGLLEEKRNGRRVMRPRLEEENRIVDGVFYFTPPVSPRRSDEYVPEYELLESPYDMCVSEPTDKTLKLIEKYSGPKSLVEKIRKTPKSCNCNNVTKEDRLVNQKKDLEETRRKLMELKSPEERWKAALKDAALMDYFTQRGDNAPCWTSCKKFTRSSKLVKKCLT